MSVKKRKKFKKKTTKDIFREYQKVQELGKSWNPPPRREDLNKTPRLHQSVERRAGFINCAQGYFNVGKYKGIKVKDVPTWYLTWVIDKIELNNSELNLIRKVVKTKQLRTEIKKVN
jgi:hypothetical protein